MMARNAAVIALLMLTTCNEDFRERIPSAGLANAESSESALGTIPPSESAVWQETRFNTTPEPRYLQAAAFDSARQMVVMFGGARVSPGTGTATPAQEMWEWSTTTGTWTNRTAEGSKPDARSGAGMVYDARRAKIVLFGGRAGSGYNYEDTWEWDPATGLWTDISDQGDHPSGRSQHGMVYEASTGKVLLFGGGRSDDGWGDASGITMSEGDTWELVPSTHVWTALAPATAPTPRHAFGLAWDSTSNRAILFGGLQVDLSGVKGIPKQDTWEWDPATAEWTDRTDSGTKPGQRYGQAMAFDGSRGKVVLFGGFDMTSGGSLADVWDWDPATFAWTLRMTGAEKPGPAGRQYAALVSDDARARLELVAGEVRFDLRGTGGTSGNDTTTPTFSSAGSSEVWELDPGKPVFTDRTVAPDAPAAREGHCMAHYPPTGKVYLFGGTDNTTLKWYDDLWAWDGKVWAEVAAASKPSARASAGLAFDPVRQSLILFGGSNGVDYSNETWEWTPVRGWVRLAPATSPDPLAGPGMVTDSTRNKILLFGGTSVANWTGGGSGGSTGTAHRRPERNEVWEWDGATLAWTNRTPLPAGTVPAERQSPQIGYDSGQKKLFLSDGGNPGTYAYWLWDPISAGWASYQTDGPRGGASLTSYDSIRRRVVLFGQVYHDLTSVESKTWELDPDVAGPVLYERSMASPPARTGGAMTFDSTRGVVVLFGGSLRITPGVLRATNETWEYRVTGLGNGEGCTAAFASLCASGNCVDGVCCDATTCTGACKSCNVPGSRGTCVLAKAGTEVPGSCASGQACDGSGNCMSSNGQPCSAGSTCASGNCVEGVCCDKACAGTCVSCAQAGLVGKCTPFAAGTDPRNECGEGTGVCKSTCDGASGCAFPHFDATCDTCMSCDGAGACRLPIQSPYCDSLGAGASGGSGNIYPTGGSGGSGGLTTSSGGSGGTATTTGATLSGGARGTSTWRGGAGGTVIPTGGTASRSGGAGGSSTLRGGAGGAAGSGTGGSSAPGGKRDGSSDGRDATPDAAGDPRLRRSGCSCGLGRTGLPDSIPDASVLVLAMLLVRPRRCERPRSER